MTTKNTENFTELELENYMRKQIEGLNSKLVDEIAQIKIHLLSVIEKKNKKVIDGFVQKGMIDQINIYKLEITGPALISFILDTQRLAPVPSTGIAEEKPDKIEPEGFLNLAEVIVLTKLSQGKIYQLMKEGSFPKNIKIATSKTGRSKKGWWEDDIQIWIEVQANVDAAILDCVADEDKD